MHWILKKIRRETVRPLSKFCLKKTTIEYRGQKFRVPLIYGVGAGHHLILNDFMYSSLKTFLKYKDGAVIDIGANMGLYLLTLRALDSQREYYGFEPNPMCSFYTIEMIRLNQFKNARLFPFALSNKKELSTLYAARPGDKMGSLHANFRDDKRLKEYSFDLFTFKGDEIFEWLNIESICAMKIDVEGSEVKVLQGIKQTISRYRPYVYCEVWPLPQHGHPNYSIAYDNRVTLCSLINELGYLILGILPDHSLFEIKSDEEFGRSLSNDFIFAHHSNAEQLLNDYGGFGNP